MLGGLVVGEIMSESSGPVRTLPGTHYTVNIEDSCDDCDNKATHKIQGETDSFGCEYMYFCDQHYGVYKNQVSEIEYGCDACCHQGRDVRWWRDPDEGIFGRVYLRCESCRIKHNGQCK